MSNITLYNVPPSLCSQKVRLVLVEKRVEYTDRFVDIGPTSQNYEPWYVRLNPKCVVPTLTHGDKVITDSAVIMRYVEDTFDGPELLPADPALRELVLYWYNLANDLDIRLLSFSNGPSLMTTIMLTKKLHKLEKNAKKHPELRDAYEKKHADILELKNQKQDLEACAEENAKLDSALDEMDQLLKDKAFLGGDSYSLADVIWTVVLTRIEFLIGVSRLETRPNILAYYSRLKQRPSYLTADLWPYFKISGLLTMIKKTFGRQLLMLSTVLGLIAVTWWFVA
jgi:tetrachloro-p-hydroquinone reductive dehalogenase